MSLTEYKVLDLNETICQKPLTSTLKVREKLNIHGKLIPQVVKLLLSQQQSNANSIAISNLKKNKH